MSAKSKKEDTPSTKSARLAKSRNSFRFGKNKSSSSTSRASTSSGKTIPVRGHSSVEELERKQGEVLRLLAFFENALEKKIPDYLVGLATMILENVILLSRDVDQMVPNSNSSEVSSLVARLNQSVAELVLWNDQFHLYGDDKHTVQSIESITSNVKQAVKDLVEFAINKENQNVTNFFNSSSNATAHNESNGSLCIQDSPQTRKKLNGSRNSHVHGSMPEIPSYGNGSFEQNSGQSSSCDPLSPPSKLAHSVSSDSILDNKEGVTSPPNKHSIYVEDNESRSSFDDSAPPIPPKKSGRNRQLLNTSSNENDSSLRQISPINSSFSDVTFPRHSTGSLTSCSTPHSLGQVSPATSQDSMTHKSLNHSLEDRASYSSAHSFEASPLHSADLTTMLSQNCGLSPIRKFCPDNSFSSLDSPLLHTTNEPRVTSSFTSSYSCSMMTTSKSYISQTEHSFNEGNRIRYNSDSLKCSRPISSSSSQMTFSSNQQHLDIQRNSRSSTCSSSSRSSGSEGESNSISVSVPPPIPKKKRGFSTSSERAPSHYDNVDGPISSTESVEFRQKLSSLGKSELSRVQALSSFSCSTTSSSTSGLGSSKSSMTSCDSNNGNSPASNSAVHRRIHETLVTESHRERLGEKPPLPLKQKHIIEYMQIFKDYQMPDKEWFSHRRSQQMVASYKTCSVNYLGEELDMLDHLCPSSRFSLPSTNFHLPPALPPKRKSKTNDSFQHRSDGFHADNTPPLTFRTGEACTTCACQNKENTTLLNSSQAQTIKVSRDVECLAKEPIMPNHSSSPPASPHTSNSRLSKEIESVNFPSNADVSKKAVEVEPEERNLLDLLNVDDEIVFKDNGDDSDVKAGAPDALLVYATYSKNGPYLEAFLTTYRTFMSPAEVISKLFYRYYKFICSPNPDHQKAAKNAFSLLVRAVHDLVVPELTEVLLKDLAEFEYNLLAKGDLKLGLYFRKKLSEKLDLRKRHKEQFEFSGHYITIKDNHQYTMLEFKSQDVADQMTLLDSELFSKVGIPELLHFSRDQNEEQCPNLKVFAMQINNMSSWVETQILRSSPPDREKYYKKFIKIMKHLRKINNNFNSCIAILSGLESAAVCRLDWPKTCTDTLKEYRDLFGFERSYRAYRQALAETKPPCIPHLGIILQDLTKLHNVNPNNTNGKVNFLKRWLQFNILEDMKRFIPSKYDLPRNETIINFINNFEDCMSEEDLWELSLSIKPQAKPK